MNHPLLRSLNTDENVGLIEELQEKVADLEKDWSEHSCSDDEVSSLESELDDKDEEIQSLKELIVKARMIIENSVASYSEILRMKSEWLGETTDIKVEL